MPFVALPLTGADWLEQQPDQAQARAMIAAVIAGAVALFISLYTRNQIYKENWQGDVIQPAGYRRGNSSFVFYLTIGAMAILMISLMSNYPAPTLAAAPILLGLMAMNFPNGKPMLPAPPRIGIDGDEL